MKMIGNVSDWLSYAGRALIKVADSAGSTVLHNKPRLEQCDTEHRNSLLLERLCETTGIELINQD